MKKWMENLKISKKLSTGFLFIAFLGFIIGAVGIININNLTNNQEITYNESTMGIEKASEAEINFVSLGKAMTALDLNYDDADARAQNIEKCEKYIAAVNTSLNDYSKTVSSDEDQKNLNATKTAFEAYLEIMNKNLSVAKSGAADGDKQLDSNMSQATSIAGTASDAFSSLADYNDTLAQQNLASNKASATRSMLIMIVVIVITCVLSVLLSKFISGIISDPVGKFAKFGELLAAGDINTDRILTEKDSQLKFRKDEIGTLADAYNRIIAGTAKLSKETEAIAGGDLTTVVSVRSEEDVLGKALAKLVGEFSALASNIITASEQVEAGAKQVADSSTALSQGATEQASSIEELSASIAEVSQRVKGNADDAEKARSLSTSAGEIMNGSLEDMNLAKQAMDEISSTSKNISKVIKAIDDIAFQTNILALNAAVEAARAGAAGKGFAVVADEVRNLSHKSSEAAKDSTSLIESSIQAVDKGTKLVSKASESFTAVTESSAEINRLVGDISAQAQEQAGAIAQISIGVEQISSVVQMNSATSEEAAAASEELSSQATYLKQNASVFKIK